MNEIEYIIDDIPVEVNWPRLVFSFPNTAQLHRFKNLGKGLDLVKKFLSDEGYRINIDFKIIPDYYSDRIEILMSPKLEKEATLIMLKWDPKI